MMSVLKEQDEKTIRKKLEEVDEYLTRECFFCGGMLIDMIDNDIEIKVEDELYDEIEEDMRKKAGKKEVEKVITDDWEIE